MVTAALFTIGKLLIALYLRRASVADSFGAAGSIIVILVWIYYSAQILFFGAEFTQVYASHFGSLIVPEPQAEAVVDDAAHAVPREERQAAIAERDHAQARAPEGQAVAASSQQREQRRGREEQHGVAPQESGNPEQIQSEEERQRTAGRQVQARGPARVAEGTAEPVQVAGARPRGNPIQRLGLLAAGLLLERLRSRQHGDGSAEPPERERTA